MSHVNDKYRPAEATEWYPNDDTTAPLVGVAITPNSAGYIGVTPIYRGVDRPNAGGWAVHPGKLGLARRLAAATLAGSATGTPELCTDNEGRTYYHARHLVGRRLPSELARLGY